ncbi:kinase-like protein [Tilletiaria anomala UBC 951]|uniref:non-specific serine/threonine protein kinase n=1 Tax=Tilletiaria anomala (strain ATCC 24038 / CBS 436.72 / UBC 951) TaxID=1037660 RepID=A0A066W170_TILAU|nr:kinase-like protein [Tilletiaria anomala UBC 951]KDN44540.1 kinase-like protein [Tilletiaria anomala UBC 951]
MQTEQRALPSSALKLDDLIGSAAAATAAAVAPATAALRPIDTHTSCAVATCSHTKAQHVARQAENTSAPEQAAGQQQVEEEEIISPLFDPSGLSSSISSGDTRARGNSGSSISSSVGNTVGWGSLDLNSVTAKRLGIASPYATSPTRRPLTIHEAGDVMGTEKNQEEQCQAIDHRRGRRRRSSVILGASLPSAQQQQQSLQPLQQEDAEAGMWWARRDPAVQQQTALSSITPAGGSPAAGAGVITSTATASAGGSSSERTISPAAEFLSAFSRVYSVVGSPTSDRSLASSAIAESPPSMLVAAAAPVTVSPSRRESQPSAGTMPSSAAAAAPAPGAAAGAGAGYQGFGTVGSELLNSRRTVNANIRTRNVALSQSPTPLSASKGGTHRRVYSSNLELLASAGTYDVGAVSDIGAGASVRTAPSFKPRSALSLSPTLQQRFAVAHALGLGSGNGQSNSYGPYSQERERGRTFNGMPNASLAPHAYSSSSTPWTQMPDDEGARVGPGGRYLLGKVFAFGGFSTVREAFDLQDETEDRTRAQGSHPQWQPAQEEARDGPTAPDGEGESMAVAPPVEASAPRRRVAVKLIYSDSSSNFGIGGTSKHAKVMGLDKGQILKEMELWRDLPIHKNILPLIWHERIVLSRGEREEEADADTDATRCVSGPAEATAVDLLVMPLCDRGSLLEFVRSEGKPAIVGHKAGLAISRTATIQSATDSDKSGPITSSSSLAPIVQGEVAASSTPSSLLKGGGLHRAVSLSTHLPSSSSRAGLPPLSTGTSSLQAVLGTSSLASTLTSPIASAGPSSASGSLTHTGSFRRASSRQSTVRSRGVPIVTARSVMRQLASGLHVLHEVAGVLHADLKLENVLGHSRVPRKTDNGDSQGQLAGASDDTDDVQWRIADFGLAVRCEVGMDDADRVRGKVVPQGGSLAYTAPELLRGETLKASVEGGDGCAGMNTPSPFATDMWAVGCMLYALVSGKLPFADPFEPRLQNKIIKADWDMPVRLKRRGQASGMLSSSSSMLLSQKDRSQSFVAPPHSPTNSLGRALSLGNRFTSTNRHVSHAFRGSRFGDFSGAGFSVGAGDDSIDRSFDLSQSLSSLAPQGTATNDIFVGSAPASSTAIDHEPIDSDEDAESDSDATIDQAWNGTSKQRLLLRKALRGLLQPDPAKRWDVRTLLECEWLRGEGGDEAVECEPVQPLVFEKRKPIQERGRSRVPSQTRQSSLSRSRPAKGRSSTESGMHSALSTPPVAADGEHPAAPSAWVRASSVAATARSRSVGRRPPSAATSGDISPLSPEWSRLIIEQTRLGSPGPAHGRRPLRASTSRESLHFKGFLPKSGSSSPMLSMTDVESHPSSAAAAAAAGQRNGGSSPVEIQPRSLSRSRGSRSGSAQRIAHENLLAGGGGESWAGSPMTTGVVVHHEHIARRSTSRSRTRAPDILASILDHDRAHGVYASMHHYGGGSGYRERTIEEDSRDDERRDEEQGEEKEEEDRGRARSRGMR